MAPHLEKIIAEIRTLPRADREAIVNALVETPLDDVDSSLSEEQAADLAYQKQLLAAGLISKIRLRRRDQEAFDRYTPISITGEPLSETIIRERR